MSYRSSRGPGGSWEGGQPRPQNVFRNDGSFLEMFKKMQQQNLPSTADGAAPSPESDCPSPKGTKEPATSSDRKGDKSSQGPAPRAPFVGKRRGGRVLPTGVVKRPKTETEADEEVPKDAWSAYLAEVKRYKETTCEEDNKTRPLVK